MDQRDIDRAKTARFLSDIVGQRVPLKRKAGEYTACCPFHQEKTPSFYVNDVKAFYHCFGCGAHGDAIDFLMRYDGLDFAGALTWLTGNDVSVPRRQIETARHPVLEDREDDARRMKLAHELWMKREPIYNSLASGYLRHARKITTKLPDQLGYVPECYDGQTKRSYPALIGAVQNRHGHVTAVQRIFLDEATGDAVRIETKPGKFKRHKATLGPMHDGCVRLGIPEGDTLGLAGSIEDALSAQQLFSLPVWATCGENRFSSVWLPEGTKRLIIFADSDPAGLREAAKAADRIYQRTQTARDHATTHVEVVPPPGDWKDWNDALRARL